MVTRPPGTAPDPCPVDPLNDSGWACRDTIRCARPCPVTSERAQPDPTAAAVRAALYGAADMLDRLANGGTAYNAAARDVRIYADRLATDTAAPEADQPANLCPDPATCAVLVPAPPCTSCRAASWSRERPTAAPVAVEGVETVEACGCFACIGNKPAYEGTWLTVGMTRMIVCALCGNKRCPHGTDHRLACTGSNEPGQSGSRYGEWSPVEPETSEPEGGDRDA